VTGLSRLIIVDSPDEKKQPAIEIVAADGNVLHKYYMPSNAHLMVGNSEQVVAGGRVELRRIAVYDFASVMRTATVGAWLHRMQARETYDQVTMLGQFGAMSPRQRLAAVLVKLGRVGFEQQDGSVRLPHVLRQHELGQAVGVSREHIGRLLSQLEREGIIARRAGWVLIPKASRLAGEVIARQP
jgi:CRP-like cAMP-binding protein